MAQGGFVAYYRVSTARQGASGLGLEAQQAAVAHYLNGGDWSIIGKFTEVESGRKNVYEAATVILTRTSAESSLRTWGLKLKERIGFKRAASQLPESSRS